MRWLAVLFLLLFCVSAEAYVGPGSGLSVLGSLWAVLVGIVLAIVAILTWPLRLLWRRWRRKRSSAQDSPGE
jgi:membrane protein implicated in regulation of membrane protease activity